MLSLSHGARNTSYAFFDGNPHQCRDDTRGRRSRLVRQRGWQPVVAAGCRLSPWVASRSAGIAAGTPTVRDGPAASCFALSRARASSSKAVAPRFRAHSRAAIVSRASAAQRDCAVDGVTLWALFHARPEKNSTGGTTGAWGRMGACGGKEILAATACAPRESGTAPEMNTRACGRLLSAP
jgi:hypothetical protein